MKERQDMKEAGLPAATDPVSLVSSEQQSTLTAVEYINGEAKRQATSAGNRCGHSKQLARVYQLPENFTAFPKIIQKAYAKLTAAYYENTQYWQSLNFLNDRQKRSERREACILIAQFFVLHVTLKDFQVKFTVKKIMRKTNLSRHRVTQALFDMKKAGLIARDANLKQKFMGKWWGVMAVRVLTDKFFLQLGISEYAIHSAKIHKGGGKMEDTRKRSPALDAFNKIGTYFTKPLDDTSSPINRRAFYTCTEPPLHTESTTDLVDANTIPKDVASALIANAKATAARTGEPWFKVYRGLEQEWRNENQTDPPAAA